MMTILLTHEHEAMLAGLHFGVGTAKAANGPKCRSTNAQEIQSPRPMQRGNGLRLGPFRLLPVYFYVKCFLLSYHYFFKSHLYVLPPTHLYPYTLPSMFR